ncbi:Putative nuclease HARBI1 [Toxocara canis]|uniref:Putative nuclease HARBI1 n=2 Tax=Toxocara canis TaxID=6265 RepID=A0A0B2V8E9_TOXCA|nr:Putative nuclease HARBI1 [Toxocara canis]VDM38679.1 unnamed protein product [Toxocara canis]
MSTAMQIIVEEEVRRESRLRRHRRTHGRYAKTILPAYQHRPSEFRKTCRLTPVQFDQLLQAVRPFMPGAGNQRIRTAERLSLTLEYIATGSSLTSLASSYRTAVSTASMIVRETLKAIYMALGDNIRLPSAADEWTAKAERFKELWNLPLCVGVVDVKVIKIQALANSNSTNFSIVLLGVVDADGRFLCANVGREDRNDEIYEDLAENLENLPAAGLLPDSNILCPFYFVGGSKLPLQSWLMKPFAEATTQQEIAFNDRLSCMRQIVEKSFDALSRRFHILGRAIDMQEGAASDLVRAAVTLHNFLLDTREQIITDDLAVGIKMESNRGIVVVNELNEPRIDGNMVRKRLMRYMIEAQAVDESVELQAVKTEC